MEEEGPDEYKSHYQVSYWSLDGCRSVIIRDRDFANDGSTQRRRQAELDDDDGRRTD
jgi:hypothetical protein